MEAKQDGTFWNLQRAKDNATKLSYPKFKLTEPDKLALKERIKDLFQIYEEIDKEVFNNAN